MKKLMGMLGLVVLALTLGGAARRPEQRILHVVTCYQNFSAVTVGGVLGRRLVVVSDDSCVVEDELAFDAAGMSDRQIRRETDARRQILAERKRQRYELARPERLIALNSALECGRITRKEYRFAKRHDLTVERVRAMRDPEALSGSFFDRRRPLREAGADCSFGDPGPCSNCWTYFNAPGGPYCRDACVSCAE